VTLSDRPWQQAGMRAGRPEWARPEAVGHGVHARAPVKRQNPSGGPVSVTSPVPGSPRSEQDALVVARFDRSMRVPIVLAAILPLIVVPESGNVVGEVVGVVSWLIFLADYVVNERRLVRYTSTWLGRFDLAVVVLTAPWYLLPGTRSGSFVVVLRLARLARVVMASRGAKRLLERLGRVGLVALGVLMLSSTVAYYAEHPTNSEFATFGDALWWGIVTLTTVGYGDIVPKTTTGRWAGVTIMVTGVAVLGVLAGSLASFFQPESSSDKRDASSDGAAPASDTAPAASPEMLTEEIAQLRVQVEHLAGLLHRRFSDDPDSPI
jgi:voltage-gated potassium channel